MSRTIWYISKYVTPPYAARVGTRGFILLREMAKRNQNCVLITSDSNHLANPPHFAGRIYQETVDNVCVTWLKTLKYKGARSIGRILSWLDFELQLWLIPKGSLPKPNIIIVSSLSLITILNGLRLRRKYSCKLVFEVRDIWPLLLLELGVFKKSNPIIWLLAKIEAIAYQKADLIVGTMPNLQEHVNNVVKTETRVACIPMGVDENQLTEPDKLPRDYIQKYIPKDKFIICHAGSIGADNALETLLSTARTMIENKSIHFLIAGEGALKQKYQNECKNAPNITFAPVVPKNMVQSILNQCDLLYFATHDNNMFKYGQSLNKIIDYMLASKPILASYSGFPSMINEANCGSFISPNDDKALYMEIIRYAELEPSERVGIGARGRKWLLEKRRYTELAGDYLTLLEELE